MTKTRKQAEEERNLQVKGRREEAHKRAANRKLASNDSKAKRQHGPEPGPEGFFTLGSWRKQGQVKYKESQA